MSDHVDGPRSIGDPAGDLTDLFAFTSPENAGRTVLAADVFPAAGAEAVFSNAIHHSIVVRRVTVAGVGNAAKFKADEKEVRFSFRFDVLEKSASGGKPVQRGTCTLPDGRALKLTVNDEKGASTPDGVFRVFAGLRSDPFFLAWLPATLKKSPNLLQHDNVLCMVVEFDTQKVLDSASGSLFGAIAETVPSPQPGGLIGHPPPRIDWIGRPEHTNMRLNNPGLAGTDDLRDLWNQQTPFAIPADLQPLFLNRLKQSIANWDLRDGKADWTPEALAANANVFLDDFLVFDVAKPITDKSHLEIEKSTLLGRPYQTGGGRTVNANVIDILLTWLVNHDREFLQGGATGATRPGTKAFPYFAQPNTELQTVAERVDLAAAPEKVWAVIGQFGGMWHPLLASIQLAGKGIGQLRTIETIDGKQIIERLEAIDEAKRTYRYSNVSGIPASDYTGTIEVKPSGTGSSVAWRAQFLANGQPDIVVRTIVSTLLKTGLESLKPRFGASK
jgi:hypothetical protein